MLAHALALSMGEGAPSAAAAPAPAPAASEPAPMQTDDDDMSEDAMLARAIAESLRQDNAAAPASSAAAGSSAAAAPASLPANAEQLAGMLGTLSGVNVDDPSIKEMLERLAKPDDKPKDGESGQGGSGSAN